MNNGKEAQGRGLLLKKVTEHGEAKLLRITAPDISGRPPPSEESLQNLVEELRATTPSRNPRSAKRRS